MKCFRELNLSDKIKYLRLANGLSLAALSRLSNISVAEICRIESGERKNPSIAIFNKLMKGLGVSSEVYIEVTGFISSR